MLRFLLLAAAFTASALRADLKPEPAEIDLGRVHQNATLTREVTLTNNGSQPVHITRVLTDCACTAAEPGTTDLAPGTSTKLKITAESRMYQGETQQFVRVRSNRGEAVISVKMNVAPYGDWDVDPSPLVLNPSKKSEEITGEITATYVGTGRAKITRVTSDADWLSAKIGPGPDSRSFAITVRKSAAAPVGNPTALLDLVSSDPAQTPIRIAVVALVTPTVRVTPNLISLPVVKPGETARANFRVVGWEGPVPPSVFASVGEARATGQEGADYLFEIVVTPKDAGTSTQQLQICQGKVVQLEVPYIVRAAK